MLRRLEAYADAWAEIRTEALIDFWSQEQFRFYKAEEIDHFFLRWPQVLDYWRSNDRLHESVALSFSDVHEIPLSGSERFVVAAMEWRIAFRDDAIDSGGQPFRHRGSAMAGFNHVLSMWSGDGDGSRLIGWCEAPEAAPLYISKLYKRLAAAG